MATAQENLQRFREISKRRLQDRLDPDKRARFDEAVDRGFIFIDSGPTRQSQVRREPQIRQDPQQNIPQPPLQDTPGETRAAQELPELFTSGLLNGEDPGQVAKFAAVAALSFDPKDIAKIATEMFPNIGVQQDEGGNFLLANNKTGARAIINRPGISGTDVAQIAGSIPAFTPAGMAAGLAKKATTKALAVGGASGLTQAGIDIAQQTAGREEDVSIKNIRPLDVAIATVGGAGFDALFRGLGRFIPVFRESVKKNNGRVTDEIRNTFKEHAEEAGINPDDVGDDFIKSFMDSVDEAVNPQSQVGEAAALQGEKEFGIKLTRGQRSGEQKQLKFEDRARSGDFGEKPQNVILKGEAEQAKQAQEAGKNIQAGFGEVIESQQQAGGIVKQGIQNAELLADDVVKEAFENIGDATLNVDGVKKLMVSTKRAIQGIEFDPSLEGTQRILVQITKFQNTLNKLSGQLKPFHIKRINNMRKRMSNAIGTAKDSTDRRQLIKMKAGFDEFLDNAVKNALFEGDEQALASLRSSNALFSEYARKFRPQPIRTRGGRTVADKPGEFIDRIVADNPTDVQVMNTLFGAANNFGNKAGKFFAQRFKKILGEDSQEWNAIKQSAFLRFVKTDADGTIKGLQSTKAIDRAINDNPELIREIFNAREIGLFRRFFEQARRTQPEIIRARENPSGTAGKLIQSFMDTIARMGQVFGVATGSPLTVIGAKGVQLGQSFRATARAKRSFRPFSKVRDTRPALTAAGTSGALSAGNQIQ